MRFMSKGMTLGILCPAISCMTFLFTAVRCALFLYTMNEYQSVSPGLSFITVEKGVGGKRREEALRLGYRLRLEADLLVLGARGHEGVARLLVGSVTTGLVHQPVVPTIVVR